MAIGAPAADVQDKIVANSDLARRDGGRNQPQAITPDQMAALNALEKRDLLEIRDSRGNCGKNVLGDDTFGGNGVWVPVGQYNDVAAPRLRFYRHIQGP